MQKSTLLALPLFLCLFLRGFSQSDTLTVVSWNVFLRPGILKDGQMQRVDHIANYLISTEADVLVLQEVFHRKASKRLCTMLSGYYPFVTSRGKTSFFGVSSGVVIYSKDSLLSEKQTYFSQHIGSDRLAKKGAVRAEIERSGRRIHIIGTHLQAGGGEKRAEIRRKQLKRIAEKLVDSPSESVIFAGDFNILQQSTAYNEILEILLTDNAEPAGDMYTANLPDQNLYPASGDPIWIDFIMLHRNTSADIVHYFSENPRMSNQFLSDHNPVYAVIVWR
jgi:endonuclease/exonuclease/phosphatase family metal-dependent hydrolase